MGAVAVGWGTWEELILGGAVLRHGTQDWNVVASELRARTLYPCTFTPQACKARYEDLQRRYSGSTAWFEELRKQRVAELKRELAKSEDSIGSLESKIKSLEGDKKHLSRADYGSSETESPLLALDSNGTESFNRETSNNENSAGSFTKDTNTRASWSCENRDQAVVTDIKPSTSVSSEDDKDLCVKKLAEAGYGRGVVMRKRRGQRNRKDCNRTIKERSASVSDNLCSNVISTAQKEPSCNDCSQIIRDSGNNHRYGDSCPVRKDSLIEIFKSVAESEPAAVFRHRMDSQKRARYRRVIKQHMDIGTIRSRIIGRSVRSAKELFRDLLLVANNALVFYSRRTREYKSAISLRHLVMKEYKKHCRGYCNESTSDFIPCNPPVKPRTVRPRPHPRPPPCKDKVSKKVYVVENVVPANPVGLDKQCDFDDNVSQSSLLKDRKGLKRPGKLKRGLSDSPSKNRAVKQRKRVRR
ncbi:hypothetical protein DH2020_008967 [Rehmannia glutinosa]|uniref:Bromo domain-containing protein n=1 Tax=Rehmannia glutinosa TaxID=99300 RepID=A0ABR0X5L0_REHGL